MKFDFAELIGVTDGQVKLAESIRARIADAFDADIENILTKAEDAAKNDPEKSEYYAEMAKKEADFAEWLFAEKVIAGWWINYKELSVPPPASEASPDYRLHAKVNWLMDDRRLRFERQQATKPTEAKGTTDATAPITGKEAGEKIWAAWGPDWELLDCDVIGDTVYAFIRFMSRVSDKIPYNAAYVIEYDMEWGYDFSRSAANCRFDSKGVWAKSPEEPAVIDYATEEGEEVYQSYRRARTYYDILCLKKYREVNENGIYKPTRGNFGAV